MSKSIEHSLTASYDALRFGLDGVKGEIVGAHPLESVRETSQRNMMEKKRMLLDLTYGSAPNLRMDLDRQILSRNYKGDDFVANCKTCRVIQEFTQFAEFDDTRHYVKAKSGMKTNVAHQGEDLGKQQSIIQRFQRPPGALPSSMLGLEALTGELEDFGVEDYINVPQDSETFRPVDMHHGMEVRLGLSKGPACPSFI